MGLERNRWKKLPHLCVAMTTNLLCICPGMYQQLLWARHVWHLNICPVCVFLHSYVCLYDKEWRDAVSLCSEQLYLLTASSSPPVSPSESVLGLSAGLPHPIYTAQMAESHICCCWSARVHTTHTETHTVPGQSRSVRMFWAFVLTHTEHHGVRG